MVAHHYAGRPESRYRYDDTGRVTEQVNPEGLDYRFEYGERRVIITDSLNRREVLYTEGEGGLKRVVKKEHADGSITRSEYDEAGRLKAQTDAAGRRTEYSLHMASGAVTAVTGPDGRTVRYGYNSQRQVTSVTYPDGLRSSREYDEKGRLAAETSRSGETTSYSYDDPASELPTGIEDATGSTKQMAWSRYGHCWPLRTARGTRRGMSTTGTVNKSPFTGRKASALTAVITPWATGQSEGCAGAGDPL